MFTQELKVEGDLNVTGTINNTELQQELQSLQALINQLQNQIDGMSTGGVTNDTVFDIDGNMYSTVIIGSQEWLGENLKVTHYNNGDVIPTGFSNTDWANLDDTETGAFAVYEDNPSYGEIYGNLYNWYAVDDDRGVCPEGWHVPSDYEWQMLVNQLGGSQVAGGPLKETGYEHWNSPNDGASNESGFTALPSGSRNSNSGYYLNIGYYSYFWSSTEDGSNSAWRRDLGYNDTYVYRDGNDKRLGFSVRCVRPVE